MQQLGRFSLIDPAGVATLASVCNSGSAFSFNTATGPITYVQNVSRGVFWVAAAAGDTRGEAKRVFEHLETKARGMGCRRIGFQTVRRGLGLIAKKRGYIGAPCGSGWAFTKEL